MKTNIIRSLQTIDPRRRTYFVVAGLLLFSIFSDEQKKAFRKTANLLTHSFIWSTII